MARTVGEFVLERLARWGVRRVFGFPGDGINGIFSGFHQVKELEFVQVRAARTQSVSPTRMREEGTIGKRKARTVSEQVVVVTGASSGVGRAIARAFGARGAKATTSTLRCRATAERTAISMRARRWTSEVWLRRHRGAVMAAVAVCVGAVACRSA